jgi:hypothetical protein
MLNPNSFLLVQAIHEERIQEALERQRHRRRRIKDLRPRAGVLVHIGDRLIALGLKLKMQAASA